MSALGFTDRAVDRASRLLGRKVSRRGFIAKTTILGSAVAASGCVPITQQGSPFTFIADCPPGTMCRDGYTEFCCVINSGQNACPPNSFPSGWWRADYSIFCNGTRYYIDCNDYAGGGPCRCAHGCDYRKVYCNHFRYGQCNMQIPGTGVIACRMVTCVPPYAIPELNCVPSGAVDNSTAGHVVDCAPFTPPPPAPAPPPPKPTSPPAAALPLGGAASPGPGEILVLVRVGGGAVAAQHLAAGVWQGWQTLPLPGVTAASRVVAVTSAPGVVEALVVGSDRQLWWQHWEGGAWAPDWQPLGGDLRSDPAVVRSGSTVHVAVRASGRVTLIRRLVGGAWSGFQSLGGTSTSDPTLANLGAQLMLLVRGSDAGMYAKRYGGSWPSGWTNLAGIITSDPAVASADGGFWAFGRGTDNAIYVKRSSSTSWQGSWHRMTGQGSRSDPEAVFDGVRVRVFIKGSGDRLYGARRVSGGWSPWQDLGRPSAGGLTSNPLAIGYDGETIVFARAANELHARRTVGGSWTAWETLPGVSVAPVRGATSA